MLKSFEDLRKAALVTDRAAFRMDHKNKGENLPEWFSLTATEYDLSSAFLNQDGNYDYRFHVWKWVDDTDIFADILGRPSNLQGDPSYIGIYNWKNGTLKREDTFSMMRMDMAFAIVHGADPVKDADALDQVFSSAVIYPVIILV